MTRVTLLLCTLLAAALGCSTLPGATGDSPVVARLGDEEVITLDELDATLEQQLYDVRRKGLEALITQRAVERQARKSGVSSDALIAAAGKSVSEREVEQFFDARKDAIREQIPDATLESVGPQIREVLENERKRDFIRSLVSTTPFEITLEPPRIDVVTEGRPALGPEDAPITIVEWSDFQCPYCRRAGPVMKQIADKYPEQVRVVYRHLPLGNHARARHSAEASACANEQGRFWDYHDVIFENPSALGDEDLLRYAEELGLDGEAFEACYRSGRYANLVREDARDAGLAGITGTPGFLMNGVVVRGFQSFEEFDARIRAELDRLGLAAPNDGEAEAEAG